MEEIYRIGGQLDLAVTLHDHMARKKSGRVYLDEFCHDHKIPLLKLRHVNDPELGLRIKELELDWLFIIGWSQIAGPGLLSAPRRGVLGIHPTLLPEGRGRAAIPWAIIKRLPKTGVTLFKLDEGVDTGPIVSQLALPIAPDETAASLYGRITQAHSTLIAKAWPLLTSDTLELTPQDHSKATVWPGRNPADGLITSDMDCESAHALVRATTRPYPGAFVAFESAQYTVWAGYPAPHIRLQEGIHIENGRLSFQLKDGVYHATDWEIRLSP